MKANELRIGNWINLKDKGLHQVYNGYEIDTIDGWDDTDYYTGIPLTEEWLLKFGFGITNYPGEGSCAELNGLQVWYQYGFAQLGIRDRIPCKYVHQLQNLYFAIKGVEVV